MAALRSMTYSPHFTNKKIKILCHFPKVTGQHMKELGFKCTSTHAKYSVPPTMQYCLFPVLSSVKLEVSVHSLYLLRTPQSIQGDELGNKHLSWGNCANYTEKLQHLGGQVKNRVCRKPFTQLRKASFALLPNLH